MLIHCDPTYSTYFTNGACAIREKIPVHMLEITPQVDANDVKFSKLGAGTTSILNISYASYSWGNFTPEKA